MISFSTNRARILIAALSGTFACGMQACSSDNNGPAAGDDDSGAASTGDNSGGSSTGGNSGGSSTGGANSGGSDGSSNTGGSSTGGANSGGSDGSSNTGGTGGMEAGVCDTYTAGMEKEGENGVFSVVLVESDPEPGDPGDYKWTIKILDSDGNPATDADINSTPFMPAMGHGTPKQEGVTNNGDGTYILTPVNLFMGGLWQVTIDVTAGGKTDNVNFWFCLDMGDGGMNMDMDGSMNMDGGMDMTQYLFVSASSDDTVRAFDIPSLTAKKTIPVCTHPAELRASKDGAYVSVVCRANEDTDPSSAWFIDTSTLTVAKKFDIGLRVTHSYVAPDGQTFFFCNDASANVSIIDTASWTQTKVDTGEGHHKVAFATDGQDGELRFAYVSNITDATVTPIDPDGWTPLTNIDVGPVPHGMSYSFVSKRVYNCSGDAAHDIEVIATDGPDAQTIVDRIPLDGGARCAHLEVTDDGKYAYASQRAIGKVARVDVSDNSVTYYDGGMGPDWFAFSAGNAWIANTLAWTVTVLDLPTGVTSTIDTSFGAPFATDGGLDAGMIGPDGSHRGLTRAGSWIIVANQAIDTASVIHTDYGTLTTLTDIPGASNAAVAGSKGGYPYTP